MGARISSKMASSKRCKENQDDNRKDFEEKKQSRKERLKNSEAKWKAAQEKKQSSPVRKGGTR